MRSKLQIIALAVSLVFVFQSRAQTGNAIFTKGELSTAKNHTGDIWLKELTVGDSTFDSSIAVATYGPVQSWIGIFIQGDRLCSSPKALATIRSGVSQFKSFTREM